MRNSPTITQLIVAQLLALGVPLLGLFVLFAGLQFQDDRSQAHQEVEFVANRLSQTLHAQFESMEAMLEVFASSGYLEEGQFGSLHRRATAALADRQFHLLVLDSEFNQLLNTRLPYGTALGPTANIEAAQRALDSSWGTVSNLFVGSVAETEVFNVIRPETVADQTYILILTQDSDRLFPHLAQGLPGPGWVVEAHDRAGGVVRESGTTLGEVNAPPCSSLPSRGEYLTAEAVVSGSNWLVCVGRPDGREYRTRTSLLFATCFLVLVVAIFAAVALGQILQRDFRRASDAARALSSRTELPEFRPRTREAHNIQAALRDSFEEIRRSEEHSRLLLREMEHRTKNVLNIAQSLSSMLASSSQSVDEFCERFANRLRALAQSVSLLTNEDWEGTDLRSLIGGVVSTYVPEESGRFTVEGDAVRVGPSATQNLALVFNELGTNAAKYGAFANASGRVTVSIRTAGDDVTVTWKEEGGPAFTAPSDNENGFGSKLLRMVIDHHFGGSWTRSFDDGQFVCTLTLARSRLT